MNHHHARAHTFVELPFFFSEFGVFEFWIRAWKSTTAGYKKKEAI
jgi:hypothetical protein